MKQKILNDIKEISKIKVTNFKEIENEEFITNMVLLACAEYIDKYNCGFMPFKLSLLGLQNMITCCINFLDDDNINLFTTLDRMLKLSDKENLFSKASYLLALIGFALSKFLVKYVQQLLWRAGNGNIHNASIDVGSHLGNFNFGDIFLQYSPKTPTQHLYIKWEKLFIFFEVIV